MPAAKEEGEQKKAVRTGQFEMQSELGNRLYNETLSKKK